MAVDLDGPCYEFDKTARYMLREYRGCEGLDEPSKEWFWHGQDWHNVTEADWDWLWTEGVKLGLFRYGHMTKDTRVGLKALTDLGHEIVIITARPPDAAEDTQDWVDLFYKDIPLTGIYYVRTDEAKVDVAGDARVLIDDSPEHVTDWAIEGKPAILFQRPWNTGARFDTARVYQANGWKEVISWFKSATSAISKAEQAWNRV